MAPLRPWGVQQAWRQSIEAVPARAGSAGVRKCKAFSFALQILNAAGGPLRGASCCKSRRGVSTTLRGWPGVPGDVWIGVSDRGGREREGPVVAGRPLVQMSPGRGRGLLLYFAQEPTGHYGARLAVRRWTPRFWEVVGGSGAEPRCAWRRNKGGGGGRRPTPEDIRRKGYRGPAPDPPTTAPAKIQSTLLLTPLNQGRRTQKKSGPRWGRI